MPHAAGEAKSLKTISTPPFRPKSKPRKFFKVNSRVAEGAGASQNLNQYITAGPSKEIHVQVKDDPMNNGPLFSKNLKMYKESHRNSPPQSRSSPSGTGKARGGSVASLPLSSASQIHIGHLLQDQDLGLKTYGIEEFRDGFLMLSFSSHHGAIRKTLQRWQWTLFPQLLESGILSHHHTSCPSNGTILKALSAALRGHGLVSNLLGHFWLFHCICPLLNSPYWKVDWKIELCDVSGHNC